MAIIKDEDCIIRKDGTLVCIERDTGKLIRFIKDEITIADVTKEELFELAQLMRKPKEVGQS